MLDALTLWAPPQPGNASSLTTRLRELYPWPVSGNTPTIGAGRGATLSAGRAVPERLLSTAEEIAKLLELELDWNSYGALPVSEESAQLVLALLADSGFEGPPPAVAPTTVGGIQLSWVRGADGVELEINPNGSVGIVWDLDGDITEWESESLGSPRIAEALNWTLGSGA